MDEESRGGLFMMVLFCVMAYGIAGVVGLIAWGAFCLGAYYMHSANRRR